MGTLEAGMASNAAEYLDLVKTELSFFRDYLNNVLERCGWPTLSSEQIDALLGGNIRSFLGL